ncbi:hypothetical protein HPB48_010826 [Haemaphysalis longicornis]|uniref:ATP-dependent DNA helicase n=1 Tax=Haemaphysalis longicornis TaxID=44386 RepID=A0A9J6GK28_HAELO|nr:hypothetical protein HPB48_010826 [Haemaphysalis longicornis]
MDRDKYYKWIRMKNAEPHELLRKIIHRQKTPSAPPLRVFFTGPAFCGKTFVFRFAMDLYNRYSNTSSNTAYNAFVICASTGKAAVEVEENTVHASFKLSRETTGPNKDGCLGASELNTFRVGFRNVKCVFIDESNKTRAARAHVTGKRGTSVAGTEDFVILSVVYPRNDISPDVTTDRRNTCTGNWFTAARAIR